MSTAAFIIMILLVAVAAGYGGFLIGSQGVGTREDVLVGPSSGRVHSVSPTPDNFNPFDVAGRDGQEEGSYENPFGGIVTNPFE